MGNAGFISSTVVVIIFAGVGPHRIWVVISIWLRVDSVGKVFHRSPEARDPGLFVLPRQYSGLKV